MNKNEPAKEKQENEIKFPFKAVICDMDGTLIETTEADYSAWKRLFAEHGKELSFEDYFPLIGMKSEVVAKSRLHLDEEGVKDALAKKMKYFTEIISAHGIKIVPYASKLLQQLREHDIRIALATSSRKKKMKM